MDNYHYIIAGLPELVLNADNGNLNYSAIRDHIVYSSAPKDIRLVEWLEFGSNEENLSPHFYRAAFKCKSNFIRKYFALDLQIRNMKVEFVSKKLGRDGDSLKMDVKNNVDINKLTCKYFSKIIYTNLNFIEKFAFITPDKDCEDLKQKLSGVTLSNSDSIDTNMDKLVTAARSNEVITEAVISTSKTISMSKDDFDSLTEQIKVLNKASSEKDERKNAKNRIKAFLKACTSEVRKCNDDRPADALVTAMINKLCKAFDCKVEGKDGITKKALLALKLNALAKAINRVK